MKAVPKLNLGPAGSLQAQRLDLNAGDSLGKTDLRNTRKICQSFLVQTFEESSPPPQETTRYRREELEIKKDKLAACFGVCSEITP